MTAFKAAYVTKYDAGGTGDNVAPDGYIKTVEKIWMDTFTFSAVITTADTITIAEIGPGRKITGVEIYFPTLVPTTASIQVGVTGNTSRFISSAGSLKLGVSGGLVANNCARMDITGAGAYVTTGSTNTNIVMQIGVTAMTAPTAGTITSIVRYT
jgi:hypothetical protein